MPAHWFYDFLGLELFIFALSEIILNIHTTMRTNWFQNVENIIIEGCGCQCAFMPTLALPQKISVLQPLAYWTLKRTVVFKYLEKLAVVIRSFSVIFEKLPELPRLDKWLWRYYPLLYTQKLKQPYLSNCWSDLGTWKWHSNWLML